eukprot:scaffold5761_cov39-Tisochrysis_lutea.AAC.3
MATCARHAAPSAVQGRKQGTYVLMGSPSDGVKVAYAQFIFISMPGNHATDIDTSTCAAAPRP